MKFTKLIKSSNKLRKKLPRSRSLYPPRSNPRHLQRKRKEKKKKLLHPR